MDSVEHLAVVGVAVESVEHPWTAGHPVPVHLWGWPTFLAFRLDGGAIAGEQRATHRITLKPFRQPPMIIT